ncbi:cysteine hydrolase family protein [Kibdelosporangium phytohabitans]|uniref:Isochorismatase n=1 Tax=Kibdelosporangium phytohabitans TaxID=860235 RepID=A0A0N7F346_9PSEU|nr:isochorismatase family cysteine hydrolase [Kibdelosporangium phytohabitans]ALG07615.1 isochorismatase [Kibdelosporangium phytohabitans]MBE1471437.1 nicotinamidase-related amidase [Kibdelosporangium phytohabitans]
MADEGKADNVDNGVSVALVMIDVLDAFFAPGKPAYYPDSVKVLDPCRELLAKARERRRLIVHAVERHRPGLADFEHKKIPVHCEIGDDQSPYVAGFEPLDTPNEVEVPKRRYSAFYATDLDLMLREQGVKTLVIAGVKTNVCVRATVQDAFAAGYEILLVKEATNSNRPHLAEASLEDIDRYFGSVVTLEQALERL